MGGGSFRLVDRAAREREEEALAPAATRSAASRGRAVPEPEDPLRTAFERDRDRILHAKAFRRLKHKTQVFLNPDGDHFVTRLTDRKSTRLNSSHANISYAVFCLKKKKST